MSNHQFCEEANLCNLLEEIIPIGVNEARVYPIHSDLYFNNFIIKDNEFKSFIDFSDIRKSYFEDDLGKFFQNLMCSQNYNIYQIEKLIEVYENITEDKMERINVYMSVIYRAIYREYCRVTKSGSKTFDKRTKEVIESLSLMMKKCKLKGM